MTRGEKKFDVTLPIRIGPLLRQKIAPNGDNNNDEESIRIVRQSTCNNYQGWATDCFLLVKLNKSREI
jgi:hypothetical protein